MTRGYTGFGRWHEAEQLQLEVLQARERTLGAEDIQTLYSMGFWLKFIETSHYSRKLKNYKRRYRKR